MEKEILSVHYNEIALKGKQRGKFERMLINNIASLTGCRPVPKSGRLVLLHFDKDTVELLRFIPGISWIGEGLVIERDIRILKKCVSELLSSRGCSSVNLDVKRVDKNYSMTSLDLKNELLKEFHLRIDIQQGYKIKIEIMPDSFIINKNITKGIGGMPIGSAGKVLSLFSGGIDSAIVPFEMMKRGCTVDLLHVYALPTRDAVLRSKIIELVGKISKISSFKLFLIPFHLFGLEIMKIDSRYELVLFKRFLLKLTERLAKEYGYKGICTGDALSQVASQTLDNLNAISYGFDLPVFRPLLTYNKDEIIKKAEFYGTYESSIKEYKDCCSIVSKNPATALSQQKVKDLESKINLEEIIDKSIAELRVEEFTVNSK